jgi:hypothetical protein
VRHFINQEMLALNVMTFPVDRAVIEEFASLPAEGNFSCITPSKEWNSDIEWISAADEPTFALFQSAFDRLAIADRAAPYLDVASAVRLYAGFLVVRSRCTDAHFHVDWSETNNEAFTFMTPVSGDASGFGLLYKRLDGGVGEYRYKTGEGIAFGDKFEHSTKPGQSERPVVLLCFVYGTDKMEYWPKINRTVGTQVTHLRQPDGAFSRATGGSAYSRA